MHSANGIRRVAIALPEDGTFFSRIAFTEASSTDSHLRAFGPGTLPHWFRANRVQRHFEGPLNRAEAVGSLEDPFFTDWLQRIAGAMESRGAKVWVGLAKDRGEGAWWPTRVGESHPLARDTEAFADYFLSAARVHGLRYLAYYRHDIENAAENAHPDWIVRDAQDNPVPSRRDSTAAWLSLYSPFADFVEDRLVELAERGADGIYFDNIHVPEVDYSDYAREAFLNKYGYPLPVPVSPFTEEYLKAATLTGELITSTFSSWKAAVRNIAPGAVFVVAGTPLAEFSGIHHNEGLADVADSIKIEFQKCFGGQQHFPQAPIRRMLDNNPDFWLPPRSLQEALAWIIARDLAHGRPAHVWNFKPAPDYGETMHTSMAIVSHGCIASTQQIMFPEDASAYQKLFALNDALAPLYARSRPYGEVAIHVSNALKLAYYPAGGSDTVSYRQRYEKLYAPVLVTAQALRQNHYPWLTTFDSHLLAGTLPPEVECLIVPSANLLPPNIADAIAELEADGLEVVRLEPSEPWHLAAEVPRLKVKVLDAVLSHNGQPKIRVESDADVFANYYIDDSSEALLVALVRDWGDFWFFGNASGNRRADQPPKPSVSGSVIEYHAASNPIKSASVIDWQVAATPTVSMTGGTQTVSLPDFDIYQFIMLKRHP